MLEGVLIAVLVLAVLACPLMAWLGRRGIGPGCAVTRAHGEGDVEERDVEELRRRQRELGARIAQLEQGRTERE